MLDLLDRLRTVNLQVTLQNRYPHGSGSAAAEIQFLSLPANSAFSKGILTGIVPTVADEERANQFFDPLESHNLAANNSWLEDII
ncbi:hypothetical protein ACI48D_14360 [Massilia sp. LXY-6]|uniref:hypothetical protein n=1 Tax=Massilia sp. LXY-6 TaxID=3379823 RepID=UPI003EE2268B